MGRGRNKRRKAPTLKPPPKTASEVGPSEIEKRLSARLAKARTELLRTFEAADPGDPRITRLQPALHAEILGLEAQLFAEQAGRIEDEATAERAAKGELAAELGARADAMRKRGRQAHADSIKWQAEARRAGELDLLELVEKLERDLSHRGDFAGELAEI